LRGSYLIIFVVSISLFYGADSAFADHTEVTITPAHFSGAPGCEETNECFIPSTVTVDVGGLVIFSNTDSAAHTFTSGEATDADSIGAVFDSSLVMSGTSFEYSPDTKGVINYFCMVHPWMTGIILVGEGTTQPPTPEPSSKGGGCLIATAIYGSELAPQVQQLRELRDNQLLNTQSGSAFMSSFNDFYYSFSPIIADYERENPVFKEMVKIAITPMISSLSILNYVDMDSEIEVLGYGISLILLNIGMYVAIPAVVIIGIRKF